jgi:general secretion pathway protein B
MPAKAEPAASAAGGRVYAQAELPPDIRRQLPPLAIGGSMYSENAANRMLIVNGQLFHENDKPAPEVTLEKIKLKSAVLRFRDYRFEVSY